MAPIAGFVDEMVAKADCAKHQYCRGFTGFHDIDEDESKGVYRDFAMPPEENSDR